MSGFSPAHDVRLKYNSVLITHLYGGVICLWCRNGGDQRRTVPCSTENGRRPLTSFLILEVKVKSQSKELKTVCKKYDFIKSCNQVFHFGLNRNFDRS